MRPLAIRTSLIVCVFSIVPYSICHGQAYRTTSGWNQLADELGIKLADGSGMVVSQVEAPTGVNEDYLPNPANSSFLNPDKNFIDLSDLNPGVSGHANSVGRRFYGNTTSIAPGVLDINNYEANDWINNATGIGVAGNDNPAPQPFIVQNDSWVASGLTTSVATAILARVDYMANENNMNIVVGVANGSSSSLPQLLAHSFNSLSIGVTDGDHSADLTRLYIVGRTKPEIVSPEVSTSHSTARVSAAATILRHAGQGTAADNNELAKALLLAGATKTEFPNWARTSDVPIDTKFGAGELNIYNAYKILLAGETDGQNTVPQTPAGPMSWDFDTIMAGETLLYSIELLEPADHLSIALTWNLAVIDSNPSPTAFTPIASLPDMDLIFTGNGITDDSMSPDHNIEHVYLRNVPAGTYTLILLSDTTTDFGLAWRAASITETAAEQLNLVAGTNSGGSLADVGASDDNYYETQPSPKLVDEQFAAVVEFEATVPVNMPNSIQFDLESHVNTPNVEQEIQLFNFTDGEFVTVETTPASILDSTVEAYLHGEILEFVEPGTDQIRARATWRAVGPVLQFPWTIRIDKASWSISQ